ncbi:predicted protein [Naegleria gruberi]|uniref:Predicted protein n=1 Tax=Naegleria gruberi TaxID=5762 RepID=D2VQ29_NAEGR|nr:uncharacterized protein NAEGRDRAFT_51405 [Naegleria gruberi]EFC41034.1 predicted protein [Naegleria gruberi]|eukprot:XP_002673778.1 predicted protein [Naegleria gruberi strain NEG-M]
MSTSGKELIIQQIHQQLGRLLKQLEDVEDNRELLDSEEEYLEIKGETLKQLEEFQNTLNELNHQELASDQLSSFKMAIQAACSQAFKTPEIILSMSDFREKKSELLSALQKLGVSLNSEQTLFLKQNMSEQLKQFVDEESKW